MIFRAPGKWILAGEHAVLRGCPALVFPVENSCIELSYEPTGQPLRLECLGDRGEELKLVAWGLIENATQRCGRQMSELTGRITLLSSLALGSGLGASAALCVVVGRWLCSLKFIDENDLYDFSRSLEDLFHGESSGVDIAVALANQGLKFVRGGERVLLSPKWHPHFYLSYCGHRGITSECVAKVKRLFTTDSELAFELDRQMSEAVRLSEEALMSESQGRGERLAEAIELARNCFFQWGLIDGDLEAHMRELREEGALAVKPTGSGGGGYVLSLWREPQSRSGLLSV